MTNAERRHVCRLVDVAVQRCEEANLGERRDVPRWVADLIVSLQAAVGEPLTVPADTSTAHGQLLDLRRFYMARRRVPERRRAVRWR